MTSLHWYTLVLLMIFLPVCLILNKILGDVIGIKRYVCRGDLFTNTTNDAGIALLGQNDQEGLAAVSYLGFPRWIVKET